MYMHARALTRSCFGVYDVPAVHMPVRMRALHVVIDINQRCALANPLQLGEYE